MNLSDRKFAEGMLVSFHNGEELARILSISDKGVIYKSITGGYETREPLDFFSSLAPKFSKQKYRWEVIK